LAGSHLVIFTIFPALWIIEFDLQGENLNDAIGQLVQDFKHGVVVSITGGYSHLLVLWMDVKTLF